MDGRGAGKNPVDMVRLRTAASVPSADRAGLRVHHRPRELARVLARPRARRGGLGVARSRRSRSGRAPAPRSPDRSRVDASPVRAAAARRVREQATRPARRPPPAAVRALRGRLRLRDRGRVRASSRRPAGILDRTLVRRASTVRCERTLDNLDRELALLRPTSGAPGPLARLRVMDPLASFSPATRAWFEQAFAAPTPAQEAGWPAIARGGNVLIQAPTGSGKTLAAFLSAIDRLSAAPGEGLRVLYVSPLKALNYDVERNLRGPLAGLRSRAPRVRAHGRHAAGRAARDAAPAAGHPHHHAGVALPAAHLAGARDPRRRSTR